MRAALVSLILFVVLLTVWHLATKPALTAATADSEYARLMGKSTAKTTGMPTPAEIGAASSNR